MPREKDKPMIIGGASAEADAAAEAARIRAITARAGRSVAGNYNTTPSQHRNGTKSNPRTRATDGELMRMTSVHLPASLIKRGLAEAVERETTLSALVEEGLLHVLDAQRRAG